MNIKVELKENNRLVLNGVNLGEYSNEELKQLVRDMDFLAHHKNGIKQQHKDHYDITIRDIDFGHWEVSQIRNLIEDIDKVVV